MARDFGLGRLPALDERDKRFPMAGALREALPTYRYWVPGAILDQGAEPQCVAYAWKGWLGASPIRQARELDAAALYHEAQAIDEFDSTPPAGGTSVRAGAKILAGDLYIGAYVWAQAIDDLRAWVLQRGPVVVGTNWYDGMFTPLVSGVVQLTGAVVGGHAYLVTGYSATRHQFRCVNSWGTTWGQRGRFWMSDADLARLVFAEGGEACTAQEQRV